jgi:hypothetical protein
MILGRFGDGLVYGDVDEPAAVGNFVGFTGIRGIDERFNIQRPLDEISEFRHTSCGVHTGLPALNDDAGVFVSQDAHRNLPLFDRN